LLKSNDRKALNSNSIMDDRFMDGSMIFIHGEKKKKTKSSTLPLGRSLVASLILKEAIWRRLFSGNKAFTYHYAMMSKIKSDIMDRTEDVGTYYNADWLVIDDVFCEPDKIQSISLDKILSHRISKNLPCIICLEFNMLKRDSLESIVGRYIPKLLNGENTFLINLGQYGS